MSSQYTLFEFDDGSCDVDSLRIVLNGKVEKGENVCHGRNVLFMLGSVAKYVAPSGGVGLVPRQNLWDFLSRPRESADRPNCKCLVWSYYFVDLYI